MSVSSMIVPGIAVALLLDGIAIYNRLVSLKHNVSKAWSNIDVLLEQRHDELPKLVATCRAVSPGSRTRSRTGASSATSPSTATTSPSRSSRT